MRVTDARGDPCSREAVQALLNEAGGHTISLTHNGSWGSVSMESGSHNFDCRFDRVEVDNGGFTSEGTVRGSYWCEPSVVMDGFRCSTGRQVSLIALSGMGISGRVSNDEIRGTWGVLWEDQLHPYVQLETTVEYEGKRL